MQDINHDFIHWVFLRCGMISHFDSVHTLPLLFLAGLWAAVQAHINPKLCYVLYPNTRIDLGDIFSFGIEFRLSL